MAVGISELMEVLNKSGLPMGNPQAAAGMIPMQKEEQIRGAAPNNAGAFKDEYRAKLDRIAQMDQRLGKLYGDPGSELYIEHALQREKPLMGAEQTGYRDLDRLQGGAEQANRETENTVQSALDLYEQLNVLQKQQEAAVKKSGAGKTSKSTAASLKQIKSAKKGAENELLSSIGINDVRTREVFLNSPEPFQEYYIRNLAFKEGTPPQATENLMRQTIDDWETNFKYQSQTKTADDLLTTATQEPRDILSNLLGIPTTKKKVKGKTTSPTKKAAPSGNDYIDKIIKEALGG